MGSKEIIEELEADVVRGDFPQACIFYGDPGLGKTTAALAAVKEYMVRKGVYAPETTLQQIRANEPIQIRGSFYPTLFVASRSQGNVDYIKGVVTRFMQGAAPSGVLKFIIFDEADGMSKEAVQELRTLLERYSSGSRTIFTTNSEPRYALDRAIVTRAGGCVYHFRDPSPEELKAHLRKIAKKEGVEVPEDVLESIVKDADGVRDAVGRLGTKVNLLKYRREKEQAPPPFVLKEGEEKTLKNPAEFEVFVQDVMKRLNPEADMSLVRGALVDVDKTFTRSEAIDFIEKTDDVQFAWIRQQFARTIVPEEDPLEAELRRNIQAARNLGITNEQIIEALRKAGLDFAHVTTTTLQAANNEIGRLKAEVEELKKKLAEVPIRPPPTPPVPTPLSTPPTHPPVTPKRPEMVPIPESLTEDNVDALFANFKIILTKKMQRDLNAAEINQFEDLISKLRKQKPPPSLSQARSLVEGLARSIGAIGTSGRIIIRRGQERINALLEKMLQSGLTPEEEEELNLLRSGAMSLPEEEIEYVPPDIRLIADSGPFPPPTDWQGKPNFPRELGRYWDERTAEQNAENFRKKGFVVRVLKG